MSGWDTDALRDYVDHGFRSLGDGSVTLKCVSEHEALTFEMGGTHGTFERLAEIACPVLVLAGNLSSPGPAAAAALVAHNLPHGSYKQFDHLTHFGPMEAPALIAQTIAEYFSGLSQALND